MPRTPGHALITLGLLLVLPLIGCDGDRQPVDVTQFREVRHAPDAPTPQEAARGGELTIALMDEATSLDPHRVHDAAAYRVIENLYSSLMRHTDTLGEVEWDLLSSYQASEDYRIFNLTIREDAYFHETGRNVTAEDVKYSLERIRDVRGASALGPLEEIQVTGEHALTLHFAEPMTPLINYLADPMWAIVDRQVVERQPEQRLERVGAGSGPFRLEERSPGQRTVLVRDENYYVQGLPYLDRVIYRPIPDDTSRTVALVRGDVDIVLDVPVSQLGRLQDRDDVILQGTPGTFWEYIGINTDVSPFDDVRVRQAIAWAVDRDAVNRSVHRGAAQPTYGGFIPPGHWAHLDEAIYGEPNLERARTLLAEAGYADGFATEIIVNADRESQWQAAALIRQMLAGIGIDATVSRIPAGNFFSRLGNSEFEMTVVGWVGLADPDERLYEIFHSNGPYNQQNYHSPRVDELLEEARRVDDEQQRGHLYRQAQRIIAEEAPVVFLYLNEQLSGYRANVQGFEVHPNGTTIFLRETWLQERD